MYLSLLKGIHHTGGARFLARGRNGCLKGTRRDVLLQIEQRLTDKRDQRIFWLNGLAGTEKSTIAQTFAEMSSADGKLGASFFCSRDYEDRSNPTLAFQLAHRYPQFRKHLLQVLRVNHDVERESLSSQLEKIIVGPFKESSASGVVHALEKSQVRCILNTSEQIQGNVVESDSSRSAAGSCHRCLAVARSWVEFRPNQKGGTGDEPGNP